MDLIFKFVPGVSVKSVDIGGKPTSKQSVDIGGRNSSKQSVDIGGRTTSNQSVSRTSGKPTSASGSDQHRYQERNWLFLSNSNVIIVLILQPDGVNHRLVKLFDLQQ